MLTYTLFAVTLSAAASPTGSSAHLDAGGTWNLSGSVGISSFLSSRARWMGEHRGSLDVQLERHLLDLVGRWSVRSRLGVRGSGDSSTTLSLTFIEGDVGVIFQFPRRGLFGVVFPYGHAGLSAGIAHVSIAGDDGRALSDSQLSPGTIGGAGVRVARPGNSGVRLYSFLEGSYARRKPVRLAIGPADDTDPEPIEGATVRLGRVSLTGYAWRIGVGLAW